MAFYPAGRRSHPSIHDPAIRSLRLGVLKAAVINFIILQILFLGLFCYLFGSLFQETTHIHNLNVVFVDYDTGGTIGQAIRTAYNHLQGPGFPTLTEHPPSQYPTPESIRHAVCNIQYWGGLYITANASALLAAAFTGTTYNPNNVLTLIWNGARYPTPSFLTTLTTPWTLTSNNIQPTPQGSRLIYNTLVIILILIQEFFYLGYLNTVYTQFHLYTSVSSHRIATIRQLISATYTLIGSLCTTAAIWAFKHGWSINTAQFFLSWATLWLFAHLNFLVLDVFTVWLPLPVVPMALISWIVVNVTSILLPFELQPMFYKGGYALPAHAAFQVLVDVWSGGCNPLLGYAVPVMLAYEVLGVLGSVVGVYRRAHFAVLAETEREGKEREKEKETVVDGGAGVNAERKGGEGVGDGEGEDEARRESEGPSEETARERESMRERQTQESADLERRRTATLPEEGLGERILQEMSRVETSSRQSVGPCLDLPFKE
ncbi:nitrosoguanidine resistance protein SNG1 [Aspergillus heteromorphus CBS 117.55]|uniref:Nitrosoguanidine resistance protein SNG1 n=1 Tax=Aspergillus heteromorphus CBS 117.55 TaxID=1448321 RepID=A0A317V497_9EURO|nr:nitrosoguanidine resistance protein SNG1 [Aspergillus heteromorphus CBS 117.55]PWY69103.1 nitrosoguanidine resistance protein SNG1 [Aspergillus heteromorphus CBS 117.55]